MPATKRKRTTGLTSPRNCLHQWDDRATTPTGVYQVCEPCGSSRHCAVDENGVRTPPEDED